MKKRWMLLLLALICISSVFLAGCDLAAVQQAGDAVEQVTPAKEETPTPKTTTEKEPKVLPEAAEPKGEAEEEISQEEPADKADNVEEAETVEEPTAKADTKSTQPAEEPIAAVEQDQPVEEPAAEIPEPIEEGPDADMPEEEQTGDPSRENEEFGDTSLTVSTTEKVVKAPDIAYVVLGVRTEGASAELAQLQNSRNMESLLRALEREGVAEDDIETSYVNVYQDYEDATKYVMENNLRVTIRDMDTVGELIDVAIKAGANTSYSLTFALEDRDAAYLEALGKAVQSIRAKATTVAESGGYKVLGAISIVEEGSSSYYDEMPMMEAAAEDATGGNTTPVVPGEIEVIASVRGTFSIQ